MNLQIVEKLVSIHRAMISYIPLDGHNSLAFLWIRFILLPVLNNLQSCKIAKKVQKDALETGHLVIFLAYFKVYHNFSRYQILH